MKLSIADAVNRYTILLLKKANGLDVDEELRTCRNYLQANKVDHWDYELARINGLMWDVENKISEFEERDFDLLESEFLSLAEYCIDLRKLNKKRIAAKNKISEEHGGYLEQKNY